MARYALVVGINRYRDEENIHPLRFAVQDARQVYSFFRSLRFEADALMESEALCGAIEERLREVSSRLEPGDLFLFYFAGHGYQWGMPGEERQYLLAWDADLWALRHGGGGRAVPMRLVEECTRGVGAGRVVVLDACRSSLRPGERGASAAAGMLSGRDIEMVVSSSAARSSPLVVVSSCRPGQLCYEHGGLRGGLFTTSMLEVFSALRRRGKPLAFTTETNRAIAERMRRLAEEIRLEDRAGVGEFWVEGDATGVVLFPGGGRVDRDVHVPQVVAKPSHDPEEAEVKEWDVEELEVEVERVEVAAPAATEGLPPVGEKLRTLRPEIAGMEKAIAELKAGTHRSLERAKGAVREAELQLQTFEEELAANEVDLPPGVRERLEEKVSAEPHAAASEFCRLAPGVKPSKLLPFIARLRNVQKAKKALESVREQLHRAVERKIAEIEAAGKALRKKLQELEERDLERVLRALWPTLRDADLVEAWPELERRLRARGYRWDSLALLEKVETFMETEELRQGVQADAEKAIRAETRGQGAKSYLSKAWEKRLVAWRKAAERGIPEAQWLLGLCHDLGVGVDRRAAEAARWYRKAAEQGYAAAQFMLGACYASGSGVPKDKSEGLKWLRKAAEQRDALVQYCLGWCYAYGMAVPRDWSKAVKWYLKAAGQGHAEAEYELAKRYYWGWGVPEDASQAADWYRKAAEQGHVDAQYKLAECYCRGEGVPKDKSEAVKWYRRAAEQGHAGAQYELGQCYCRGEGVPKDESKAVQWYRKAVEQGYMWAKEALEMIQFYREAAARGDAEAQYRLGNCYYSGTGVAEDKSQAVKWYRKAAEQGYAKAQYNLGRCYAHGEGVPKNESEAVKWFRKAAEHGADYQFALGAYYDERGDALPEDKSKAVEWYRKAAEGGYAEAQYRLGVCYYRGNGVPQDKSQAVKWFGEAAQQGHREAQYQLGVCYYYGKGVPQDKSKAVEWFRDAAGWGYAAPQYCLGVCYERGEGVEQDKFEAVEWYRMAAEEGYAAAQNSLGWCYAHGAGIAQDKSEAVKWYSKAADQGDVDAQWNLGWCYAHGEGVRQDESEAVKWYQRAAEQGDPDAMYSLGLCYDRGEGVRRDKSEAVRWYRKAAEQGHMWAVARLREFK